MSGGALRPESGMDENDVRKLLGAPAEKPLAPLGAKLYFISIIKTCVGISPMFSPMWVWGQNPVMARSQRGALGEHSGAPLTPFGDQAGPLREDRKMIVVNDLPRCRRGPFSAPIGCRTPRRHTGGHRYLIGSGRG